MCDPFNTSTEAALWDEREDLDPFMAEHHATNAQHELDRILTTSPLDQQCFAHVRRLLGKYHALAALAQLPDDSDFEDKEVVGSEDMAFVHPDRAARMRSDSGESEALSSPLCGRSMITNSRNDGVAGDEGDRSCSRDSSVESIARDDERDGDVYGQQSYADRYYDTQQQNSQQYATQRWAPPPTYAQRLQQILDVHQFFSHAVAYNQPSQTMGNYHPPPQPTPMYHQPDFSAMVMALVQTSPPYSSPSDVTTNFGPTVIDQNVSNVPQPQEYESNQSDYGRGYDEILLGGNGAHGGSRDRGRRRTLRKRR
jgi:hypothetical protein